jgi:tRNA pseudouridine38-40 synthase
LVWGLGGGAEVGGEGRQNVGQGRGGEENFIRIEIEADGFLYNMVRAIVGTLVPVGRGVRPESWPAAVLAAADRRLAGPTAPPQGLCLMRVEY